MPWMCAQSVLRDRVFHLTVLNVRHRVQIERYCGRRRIKFPGCGGITLLNGEPLGSFGMSFPFHETFLLFVNAPQNHTLKQQFEEPLREHVSQYKTAVVVTRVTYASFLSALIILRNDPRLMSALWWIRVGLFDRQKPTTCTLVRRNNEVWSIILLVILNFHLCYI